MAIEVKHMQKQKQKQKPTMYNNNNDDDNNNAEMGRGNYLRHVLCALQADGLLDALSEGGTVPLSKQPTDLFSTPVNYAQWPHHS